MDELQLKLIGVLNNGFNSKDYRALLAAINANPETGTLAEDESNMIYVPYSKSIFGFDFNKKTLWLISGRKNPPVFECCDFNTLEEICLYKDERPIFTCTLQDMNEEYEEVLEAFLYSVKDELRELLIKLKMSDGKEKEITFFHSLIKYRAKGIESWLTPLNLTEGLYGKLVILQANEIRNDILDKVFLPAINCCLMLKKAMDCD